MNCGHCKKALSQEGDKPCCSNCKIQYHFACTTVTESSWKTMTKQKRIDWICHVCRKQEKSGAQISSNSEERSDLIVTLQKLLTKEFTEFEKKMNKKFNDVSKRFEDVEKSLEFTSGTLEDLSRSMKNIEQKAILLERKQEKIEAENTEMKTRIKNLEVEVKELQQAGLNNKMDVSGLPNVPMDLPHVAKQIVEKVGFSLSDVGPVHVVRPIKQQAPKSTLVLTFRSSDVRNQVIGKMRNDKIKLKARDIITGNNDDTPVFVNESLSSYYRKLFYEAKKLKAEKNYAFLWIKDGKILLKKTPDGSTLRLTCLDDLAKI